MFVPLRVHSAFSRGQGGLVLSELAAWAAGRRLPAAALTDIGNLYGWAGWKRTAERAGIKPLFGCEIALGGRTLVLLVRERTGYSNLVEVLNRRELTGALDGLVAIYVPEGASAAPSVPTQATVQSSTRAAKTGRTGGGVPDAKVVPSAPTPPVVDEAALIAAVRERVAPGDLYLGADFANFSRVLSPAGSAAMSAPASASASAAPGAADRAGLGTAAADLPVVWAGPLKFIGGPERLCLLRAIENKVPYPPERDRFLPSADMFGPDQAALAVRRFGLPAAAALKRTFEAAEKCAFSFEGVVPNLPSDIFPRGLRQVVTEKLRAAGKLGWAARERVSRELEAVERAGFGAYFLIVHDIVEFARGRGILHNMRGSGASSYLAFLLGISSVNPLEFDLYFERFLNPGRPEPPDIDLDFDSRRRDEVMAYVLEKYGSGKTGAAFVCSLKDFGARSALYETIRSLGAPPDEARSLSKRAPLFAGPECLGRAVPPAGCREAWMLAASLQDVHHEVALHVGGVIITPAPVERFLPLDTSAGGLRMTHYDRDAVDDLKLIKLDLLSVRGLAAVSETREKLALGPVPPDDARVYAALSAGRTIGCFQVESPAMRNLLRRMKPRNIQDLTQALALVRPGPTESGMKEALLRRRSGAGDRPAGPASGGASMAGGAAASASYPGGNDLLERLLPETGGILLYEEQVMQVAERAAGMPPAEGDLLRRGLKKRKGADPVLRDKFFREARERGYPAGDVERLWRTMEKFSSYSFNKAHSASYADMAYKSVYLKLRAPAIYLASVLNAGGGYYDLAEYVAEAVRCGIIILRPDVNRSGPGFEVERAARGKGTGADDRPAVRVGLTSIKGLGRKIVDVIIEDRKASGPFLSIEDFIGRAKPSKTELLALIRAAAFDSLEPCRTAQVLNFFQGLERLADVADIGDAEKKRMLYESLGFLPEGDPLALFTGRRPELRVNGLGKCAGSVVELVVRVVDARQRVVYGPSGDGPVGYGRVWNDDGPGDGAEAGPGPVGSGGRGGQGGHGGGGGPKYFYMFEDETGTVEGVGGTRCLAYGTPPVCFLRGEVRMDGEGAPKLRNCSFLRGF